MDDVLVIGGGPTGFVTALGLAQAGLEVRLIEAGDDILRSPRAAVFHWSVLDGFAQLGILDECLAVGFAKDDYTFVVRATGEHIAYDMGVLASETPHPFNVHLGQDLMTGIVRRQLEAMGNAEVEFGRRFTGLSQDSDGVTVETDGTGGPRTYRARWVVGADGSSSAVRKALGLSFDGMTWPERFVATNIRYDFARHGYARSTMLVDSEFGAIIVLISRDDVWRYTYKEDATLPEASYRERMPRFFEAVIPGARDVELVASAPYRMHQRCAARFRQGRVLLAGDAAHVTNPTGGLGLTTGLFDAYALIPALSAVVIERADPAVLDRYDESRREIFLTRTSPQAVANKQLIFHANGGGAGLDEARVMMHRMRDDLDFRRQRLLFTRSLASPPLLDAVAA